MQSFKTKTILNSRKQIQQFKICALKNKKFRSSRSSPNCYLSSNRPSKLNKPKKWDQELHNKNFPKQWQDDHHNTSSKICRSSTFCSWWCIGRLISWLRRAFYLQDFDYHLKASLTVPWNPAYKIEKTWSIQCIDGVAIVGEEHRMSGSTFIILLLSHHQNRVFLVRKNYTCMSVVAFSFMDNKLQNKICRYVLYAKLNNTINKCLLRVSLTLNLFLEAQSL